MNSPTSRSKHTRDQWQQIKRYHSCLLFFPLLLSLPPSLPLVMYYECCLITQPRNSSYGLAHLFVCFVSLCRSLVCKNPSVIELFILWLCLTEIKQWADWTGMLRRWWSILGLVHTERRGWSAKNFLAGVHASLLLSESAPKNICFDKSKNVVFPARLPS